MRKTFSEQGELLGGGIDANQTKPAKKARREKSPEKNPEKSLKKAKKAKKEKSEKRAEEREEREEREEGEEGEETMTRRVDTIAGWVSVRRTRVIYPRVDACHHVSLLRSRCRERPARDGFVDPFRRHAPPPRCAGGAVG